MAIERTIDERDHNAKILKNKQQARNIANIANRLLEKEEKKVLESNDLENFRLVIGRNPKKRFYIKNNEKLWS